MNFNSYVISEIKTTVSVPLTSPPPYKNKGFRHFGLKRSTPKKAFTLAETLITLTIIGIIAALTIPNLMAKYEEHVTVAKVKKAHALLKHAFDVARTEKGNLDEYLPAEVAGGKLWSTATMEYLSTGLKVAKDCGAAGTPSANGCRPYRWAICSDKTEFDYRNGGDRCVVLENGMLVCVNADFNPLVEPEPALWGFIALLHVDINGIKGPNKYSRDDFWWQITTDNQIVPLNKSDNPNYLNCNANHAYSRYGAVKWILLKGNMDYLHKTVSW